MSGFSHRLVLTISMLSAGGSVLAHGATSPQAMALQADPLNVVPILYLHEHHYLPQRYRDHGPAPDAAGAEDDASFTQPDSYPRHSRYFDRHSYARTQLGGPGLLFFHRE